MALLNIVGFKSIDSATVQMEGLANDNAWDADFQFVDGVRVDNGELTLQKGWAGLASNNLEQSAKSGSGLAQSCLSHMYREGFGVERDPVKAFQWCSAAAEHKDKPEATFELAMMYLHGLGVKQCKATAVLLLDVAGKQDHSLALFKLAEHFFEVAENDSCLKKGFDACHRSAKLGLVEAQFNLGVMFEDGLGTEQNFKKAATWYHRAATGGDERAMNNLGSLYWHGKGVSKDKLKAETLFALAVEENSSLAQVNLGLIHTERDNGGSPNLQALTLFIASYSNGSPKVKSLINSALKRTTVKNIIRATQNAQRFLTQKESKN
jgi:TPR repeat protein